MTNKKTYFVVEDAMLRGGDAFYIESEHTDLSEAIQAAHYHYLKDLAEGERKKTEVFVATDILDDEERGIFEWRTVWSSKDFETKVKELKRMEIEDFYSLDEVTVESDGFYFSDEALDIRVKVSTPARAYEENAPEDHLSEAYLDAWEDLKDRAIKAYRLK